MCVPEGVGALPRMLACCRGGTTALEAILGRLRGSRERGQSAQAAIPNENHSHLESYQQGYQHVHNVINMCITLLTINWAL